MRIPSLLALCLFAAAAPLIAAEEKPAITYATETDVSYYSPAVLAKADDYQKDFCKLDLYHPTNKPGYATVVWFHGGGLTAYKRDWPEFKDKGIAIATVDYRLSPKAQLPAFLEDAAASTAWVIRNIEKFGGDPKKVFVSGHSAGGYLAAMIGMDPRWLAKEGISNRQLAGIVPVSGQMTTHFLVKKLRGDTGEPLRPIIDEYAPIYHASKDLPPVCLITGDRRIEYKSRVEENDLLAVTLRNLGHQNVEFYEMGGLDHGTVWRGSAVLIPTVAGRIVKQIDEATATGTALPVKK